MVKYLCEVYLSRNPDLINKFSFASPHRIVSPLVDSSEASTHLAKCMLRYVDKDHLLLVPYNVSEYLLYGSSSYDNNCKVQEFESACIKCPKQLTSDGISCGYYVGCYIEDLLRSAETSIGINFTRPHKLKFYSPDKMVRFQKNWAGYLYNRFLKGKLLK
ncbi:hypothetical protein OROHE_010116 [Orobanche hederae]